MLRLLIGVMVLSYMSISIALIILLITLSILSVFAQEPYVNPPLWVDHDNIFDVAISSDGDIIVLSTYTQLKVYNRSGYLLWSWPTPSKYIGIQAVDVSDDGNYVVGVYFELYNTYIVFWKNARSLSGTPDPDWMSENLGGSIWKNALAISGDGNHVVAAGTGPNIFYWNNTLSLSGTNIPPTWSDTMDPWQAEYVDISRDGNVVVVAGERYYIDSGSINVYYYENAAFKSGSVDPDNSWLFKTNYYNSLGGLALSEDGRYLVVGTQNRTRFIDTVTGNILWNSTICDCLMVDVDISNNGSTVIVATNYDFEPHNISIFHNAYSKSGSSVDPDITVDSIFHQYTINGFTDISLDGTGTMAIAGTGDYVFAIDTITGDIIWYYPDSNGNISLVVEISENGLYAITGGSIESACLFEVQVPPKPIGGNIAYAIPQIIQKVMIIMLIITILVYMIFKKYRSF